MPATKRRYLERYEFTPEAKAQLPAWHERWLKHAVNCEPMNDLDREIMRTAIEGLYRAAKLEPPPRERIVFVPSPYVAQLAGGFAAAIWYMRANPDFAKKISAGASTAQAVDDATGAATGAATWDATGAATGAATWDATWAATRDATRDATWAATWDATWDATGDATRDATGDATRDATGAATGAATWDATWAATRDATRDATGAATRAATWDATRAATWAATRDATWAATRAATWDATRAATWDATWDATRAATGDATWDATRAATGDATWDATRDATGDATRAATWDVNKNGSRLSPLAKWLLDCAERSQQMWAFGGEWTGYDEYVEFFRQVCNYEKDGRIDYAAWEPWHQATMHGGIRVMHEKFCIVSDRPELIRIEGGEMNGDRNTNGQLHSLDGPAKRYRDGFAIYAVHGVRIPAQIIEAPQTLTVKQIQDQPNAEVRRVMIDRFGAERYLRESGAREVARDEYGILLRASVPGDEDLVMVQVVNGSPEPVGYKPEKGEAGERRGRRWHKHYFLRVPPATKTAHEGVAWTYELKPEQYAPAVRT